MNINIKTTTFSLTPAISDYVDKHLAVIKNFLKDDSTAKCDLELGKISNHHKQGDIFKAEIHILAKDQQNIYTSIEREDLYVAIDIARDEVMRKLKETKDKKITTDRRDEAEVKNIIKGL